MILFLHFTDLMSNIDLYSRKLASYLNAVSFRRDSSLLVLSRISISANLANTYLSITKYKKANTIRIGSIKRQKSPFIS